MTSLGVVLCGGGREAHAGNPNYAVSATVCESAPRSSAVWHTIGGVYNPNPGTSPAQVVCPVVVDVQSLAQWNEAYFRASNPTSGTLTCTLYELDSANNVVASSSASLGPNRPMQKVTVPQGALLSGQTANDIFVWFCSLPAPATTSSPVAVLQSIYLGVN